MPLQPKPKNKNKPAITKNASEEKSILFFITKAMIPGSVYFIIFERVMCPQAHPFAFAGEKSEKLIRYTALIFNLL